MALANEWACPACGKTLKLTTLEFIEVHVCAEHGVWLDRGELETIVARASRKKVRAVHKLAQGVVDEDRADFLLFGGWALVLKSLFPGNSGKARRLARERDRRKRKHSLAVSRPTKQR